VNSGKDELAADPASPSAPAATAMATASKSTPIVTGALMVADTVRDPAGADSLGAAKSISAAPAWAPPPVRGPLEGRRPGQVEAVPHPDPGRQLPRRMLGHPQHSHSM
jgi:hypothetical protein